MKTRIQQILDGESGLPEWKVEAYRKLYGNPDSISSTPVHNPPWTEEQAAEKLKCIYREETTDRYECNTCGGDRLHTICRCKLLGKDCIVRGHNRRNTLSCLTCDKIQPRVESAFAITPHKWAIGMLSAPRRRPTLEQSLRSITSAGFSPLTLFAEPGTLLPKIENVSVVQRQEVLGCWRNTVQSLRDLLSRNPEAQIIALFQDDVICVRDAREYLDRELWPSPQAGLISIYAPEWPGYEAKEIVGIRKIKHDSLMGACGLIYRRECLEAVLRHPFATDWRGCYKGVIADPSKKAGADTWAGLTARRTGWDVYTFSPSMLQHIAQFSALGHGTPDKLQSGRHFRKSILFRGEDKSALDIYCNEEGSPVRWQMWPKVHQKWRAKAAGVKSKGITISIPGKDSPDLTCKCLEHIALQKEDIQVVYVDNGSSLESKEQIFQKAVALNLNFRIIENPSNFGYTKATNQGIEARRPGDNVLLLNNDCFLGPECLQRLLFHLQLHYKIAAIGPVTGDNGAQSVKRPNVRHSGKLGSNILNVCNDPFAASAITLRIHRISPVDTLSGFCMLMNGECLDQIGKLSEDEGFRQGLGTDDEWILRARKSGWKALVCYSAFAAHLHSETFRRLQIDRRAEQRIAVQTLAKYH
jgi:GT2 family glycosyltransferase